MASASASASSSSSSSASSSSSTTTDAPPPDPVDGLSDHGLPMVPIHIVTTAAQLPAEFLEPSPESHLVIGFDCEGMDLCRHGKLCIMQLAFPDAIYLVDAIEGGEELMKACKPALESTYITKVIHDCKRDSEALYFQFGIKLNNIMDTQIAYSLIEEQEGRKKLDYISFVGLLADPRYCGISYIEKEEVRTLLRKDPKFWTYRPLSDMMIRAAADDVRFLVHVYHKMIEKLNDRSLWYLAVRSGLYCQCFCVNDNDYADWPPLPPIPGYIPYLAILMNKIFAFDVLLFWLVKLLTGDFLPFAERDHKLVPSFLWFWGRVGGGHQVVICKNAVVGRKSLYKSSLGSFVVAVFSPQSLFC